MPRRQNSQFPFVSCSRTDILVSTRSLTLVARNDADRYPVAAALPDISQATSSQCANSSASDALRYVSPFSFRTVRSAYSRSPDVRTGSSDWCPLAKNTRSAWVMEKPLTLNATEYGFSANLSRAYFAFPYSAISVSVSDRGRNGYVALTAFMSRTSRIRERSA